MKPLLTIEDLTFLQLSTDLTEDLSFKRGQSTYPAIGDDPDWTAEFVGAGHSHGEVFDEHFGERGRIGQLVDFVLAPPFQRVPQHRFRATKIIVSCCKSQTRPK